MTPPASTPWHGTSPAGPERAPATTAPLDADHAGALGVSGEATLAEGLDALAARYDEHAASLAGVAEDLLVTALDGGDPEPALLRQALAPRLRPLLAAWSALDALAAGTAPLGQPGRREPGDPSAAVWPVPPEPDTVRTALGLSGGPVRVSDASVARLTITRVFQHAGEARLWTAGEPPPLATYDGDVRAIAGDDPGWTDARWEGIRSGTVERTPCGSCDGSGRTTCAACGGGGTEPCQELEPCRICGGTGKRPRAGRELFRGPCPTCNGRGAVPCPRCGGFGRRPCQACGGGTVACASCHGLGRGTGYLLGTVERRVEMRVRLDPDALQRLGRGADRYFRPLARLTAAGEIDQVGGLPAEVREQVGEALRPVGEEQLRQQVLLDVLPAIAVGYTERGQERTMYLLGEEGDLRERRIVRPRRGRWPRILSSR